LLLSEYGLIVLHYHANSRQIRGLLLGYGRILLRRHGIGCITPLLACAHGLRPFFGDHCLSLGHSDFAGLNRCVVLCASTGTVLRGSYNRMQCPGGSTVGFPQEAAR
jgi:hypothetical protein